MISRLVVLVACFAIGSQAFAGGVEYPAPGNIDLDEGTLEIWITPQAVLYPDPPQKNYQGILALFDMQVPDHFGFGASFYARGDRSALHVSMSHAETKNALIPVPGTSVDWRDSQNELHHVAFVWKGRDMRLYADGIQVGSRLQATTLSGKLAGVTFTIGSAKGRDTPMILHAVRTSNVARTADMLKGAKPVIDLHTLMLDRFGDDNDAAELISGYTGETGGTLNGRGMPVTSPTPGLALFKINKD